ncbi:Uncharacterised protein [Raoultella planticola]|uniref:Uncharacterized protein n=1 Tax=Raoultella planticola TaxID=575 RepID=A0A485BNN1_RAOPL|nr:Uncharacterised protein [Raoultella planticola]
MPGNAEVSLFRDIKDIEIRVIINGVTRWYLSHPPAYQSHPD